MAEINYVSPTASYIFPSTISFLYFYLWSYHFFSRISIYVIDSFDYISRYDKEAGK